MLPEWVMIRKLLELYYHRWQLWRDRQVMLRGRDKRLWHYVWRVKDSQSKLELLLLDQYFSVQHLSWLLVRGFCRYEHWESKIKLKKMIVAVHLHVDCCSYLGFRSTIPFSWGKLQWPESRMKPTSYELYCIFLVLFPHFCQMKVKPCLFLQVCLQFCLGFFCLFHFTKQYLYQTNYPFNVIVPWGGGEGEGCDAAGTLPNGPKGRGSVGQHLKFEKYMT